ncbi:TraB/VirB10 family protein [Nitrosomonas mobilis]|uniref:TraB pilus assembly n=1 Tax=Nitrosomonas mobilis TaxID=51642 RepID=A0A1G5SDV0_9PROT|nr:TraB/VirB10 family protein [Nitrosomonas mobilis]SCZ85030.1 TraB pilus assembly [Nitrosomonas mobilis]HNO76231.1 TraB/VirB10 family protein [Nitrosomonas mobilis]
MSNDSATNFTEYLKNLSVKARQNLLLSGLAILFFSLVFGGVYLWDNQEPMLLPDTDKKPTTRNITTPGAQVDPREVWMSQSSQQLQEMDDLIRAMKQQITDLESKQDQEPQPGNFFAPLPPPVPEPATQTDAFQTEIPPPQPYLPPPMPEPAVVTAPPPLPGIAVFQMTAASPQNAPNTPPEPPKTYIPSGTFMRSVLLGGMDAPTGGQAQNNPMPALLRVQDNAFLPNRYRAKLRECFVLGSGHGDISSERAHIRLESLSCTLKDGKVVDVPAKGYIVSEDGKAGLRGRLISKQGQIIANALMTGIIAGIGQGLQQSATSFSTSALGTVGTLSGTGNQFRAGMGAGIGRSLDRVSQYYIRLAEQLFPVIEVDAGRVVEVVLTKGIEFEIGDGQEMISLGESRNKLRRMAGRRE